MNLYSPPTGNHPQELPDRWKFADGSVRTDLRALSNQELASLDWIGPITQLKPFTEKLNENDEPILDEEGNPVLEGDYDPETHKVVWYRAKRKYVIVEKNIDEAIYDSGELISASGTISIPNWDTFEIVVFQSTEIKNFIDVAASKNILVASALPAAFFEAKKGNYNSFRIVWNEIVKISSLDPSVVENIFAVANSCNLPEEFITIFAENAT